MCVPGQVRDGHCERAAGSGLDPGHATAQPQELTFRGFGKVGAGGRPSLWHRSAADSRDVLRQFDPDLEIGEGGRQSARGLHDLAAGEHAEVRLGRRNWEQCRPVASWITSSPSPGSRPGSAVTVPLMLTSDSSGRDRADPIGSTTAAVGVGTGVAVGVGVGVCVGAAVGAGTRVGVGVAGGVGVRVALGVSPGMEASVGAGVGQSLPPSAPVVDWVGPPLFP